MEKIYSVTLCGKHIGKILVQQQGLYYHFSCTCCLPGDIIYRLVVNCCKIQENLGILVPKNGIFILNTKLPVKRLGKGDMAFTVIPKQEEFSGTFVPISPEEPFAYISRLKESFLIHKNGQVGINIRQVQKR